MTIGIDASRAFKQEKTGVERYAYNIIENLIKADSENQYILYSRDSLVDFLDSRVKPKDDTTGGNDKKEGSKIRIKKLNWPFKYFWTQGRLSLEMLFKAPDMLFVPASSMPIIHPKNTVAVIHDVGFMKYPEAYSKWQLAYLKWSTKFAAKHAKKIITISEFSKQEIIKYFSSSDKEGNNLEDKIFITLLACDLEEFKIINNPERIKNILRKYKIDTPYILFVGRLEAKKNILNIVKAFAKISHELDSSLRSDPFRMTKNRIKLVLAGAKGLDWSRVKNFIKDNSLQKDIILTGYVADEDLPYLYSGADLFLFPSLYEGFGMPVLEAMACGTPVITSNNNSLPEVAEEAAVLVDPSDTKLMADKISEVLQDNNLREKLKQAGLKQAQKFSWRKCAEKTLEIFNR